MSDKKDWDKEPMCKLKKEVLKEDLNKYLTFIDKPRYLCKKCGRVANNKINICKAYELK
jgi:hypothetical protein